jgi:hypothetical protein
MLNCEALSAALDQLGYDGVCHVSRYVMAAQGERDAGPFDAGYARACLARLTPEARTSVVAYFGSLLVTRPAGREVECFR